MNRREFCLGTLAVTAGCSAGDNEMPQEFTLQQSPIRTAHDIHSNVPGYAQDLWTPTLLFGGASVGMTGTFLGKYNKVGNLVTCHFSINLSNNGSSTGVATIGNLPVKVAVNNSYAYATTFLWASMNVNLIIAFVQPTANTFTASLYGLTAGAATASVSLQDTDFALSSGIFGTMIYYADE